jgi:hypothetical protein
MGDPILIPAAVSLRNAFNSVAPNRDKASDGWIGDTAHQQEESDHNSDETGNVPIHDADKINEVHAIDVDNNLNESDLTMEKVVQYQINRCRSGAERRLRYVIYSRRIWSASTNWIQKTYTGASPHTEHAHFSFSYDTALEANVSSWKMEEIPVALTDTDKTWILGAIRDEVRWLFNETRGNAECIMSETGEAALVTKIINGVKDPVKTVPEKPVKA